MLIKAMNSYVRDYDLAKKVMTDAVEELNRNILPNTAMTNNSVGLTLEYVENTRLILIQVEE